jgi:hypothetical protein
MGFFQAPYFVSEGFANLASNSGKYSQFWIDPMLLFPVRVDTPRIVCYGELGLLASFTMGSNKCMNFQQETLACIEAKINYAHSALLTRNTLNESEMGFAEGSIFDSLLSMIVGSWGLGILNMNMQLCENSAKFKIALWRIYGDQVKSLNEKIGSQNLVGQSL